MYAFFEGLREPAGEFLHKIAFGVCHGMDFTSDYVSALVVKSSLPKPEGIPVIGLDDGNKKHLFFGHVSEVDSQMILRDGGWAYCLTAHGRTLDESFGRIYHTSQVVKVPEPAFTTQMSSVYRPWLSKIKAKGVI
jgi:hypothetical protein